MAARNERHRWTDAVWSSDLPPNVRLVALAFVRYASHGLDEVWLAQSHLCEITGLSKPTAQKATRTLLDGGWLEVVEQPRQRRAARYRLTFSGQPACPLDDSQRSSELPSGEAPRGQTDEPRGQTQPSQRASGLPRTSSRNHKKNPHPVDTLAEDLAVSADIARRMVEISSQDPTTVNPHARLRASAAHRLEVRRVIDAADREQRERERATEPRCRDCDRPVSICDRASGLLPPGSACTDYEHRHDERKTA
ncbi:MarR family transcriptional regulator [Aeromicrobium sp. CF4.19]|uniref:MarR family transcriptional regulator n=1 Tax=Aeromicrobium sp. CF4.19 TaxID=3373082 RepID=UPI003EE53DD3